jgi:pimeloyl-ACP methyl ester carboxylesterase
VPGKYAIVDAVATFVLHRGPTTLPGHPPDTSRGPVVLCLHDAGGNSGSYAELLDTLAADHSPVAFDLPGHGRSGGIDSLPSVEAMAAHTRALADALGLASPVLVGEGLGAAVALEAAATDPTWPAGLVLCGGAAPTADVSEVEIRQLEGVTGGRERRQFDQSGYAPTTERPVYQRAFEEWLKTDPRVLLGDRRAQQGWNRRGRLGDVRCPALVVVGEHEEPEHRAAAEALAGELPRARTATLAGAGRRGVLEAPVALAALVAELAGQAVATAR